MGRASRFMPCNGILLRIPLIKLDGKYSYVGAEYSLKLRFPEPPGVEFSNV